MANSIDDADTPAASSFMSYLAGRPARVVAVTGCIAVVGTAALLWVGPDMGVTGAISALATLWGLFLALIIYLLTARDTDRLMAHIDALQDQLSAALESPGPDAEVVDGEPDEESDLVVALSPAPASPSPAPPTPAEPEPTPSPRQRRRPLPQLSERMPQDYLAALQRQAGLTTDDIRLAWTPHSDGRGPWVVEDDSGDRWSVFQSRRGGTTVIPLGNAAQQRDQRRERSRAMKQQRVDMQVGGQEAPPAPRQPGQQPGQRTGGRPAVRTRRADSQVRAGKDSRAQQRREPQSPGVQPGGHDKRG